MAVSVRGVNTRWRSIARLGVGFAALATSVFIPPPAYVGDTGEATLTQLLRTCAAIVTALVITAMARWKEPRHLRYWLAASLLMAVSAIGFYLGYNDRRDRFTAVGADGARVVIGSEYTSVGASYARAHPGVTPEQLLEDAPCANGGSECSARLVWTGASIETAKRALSGLFLVGTLTLIAGLLAAVQCTLLEPARGD
ncbi:MAG TPA: hypothetical protein VH277_09445 [Gemmatimonadaceae bacterium]|jgi:hypothetical protein|nr:hypothetical protein [Gemmatimonadaceae bacterium]